MMTLGFNLKAVGYAVIGLRIAAGISLVFPRIRRSDICAPPLGVTRLPT